MSKNSIIRLGIAMFVVLTMVLTSAIPVIQSQISTGRAEQIIGTPDTELPAAGPLPETEGAMGDPVTEPELPVEEGDPQEDQHDMDECSVVVPNPQGTIIPEIPVITDWDGVRPASSDEPLPPVVTTQSATMALDKFTLLRENRDTTTSLDHDENGLIAVDVTNNGRRDQVMTNVEVDFYYLDEMGETRFIARDTIDRIQGNGGSETALVGWKASMFAKDIKVVADCDGSDGGPTEIVESITINPANYFPYLEVAYPQRSEKPGETVAFELRVTNMGTKSDTIKLKFEGEGDWDVWFEGGTTKKTLEDMEASETRYVELTVEIPGSADHTDMKQLILHASSDNNDDRVFTTPVEVFAARDGKKAILLVHDSGGATPPAAYNSNTTRLAESALVEAGYEGMYKIARSSHATSTYMSEFDVVIWAGGYFGSLSTTEMNHLMQYLGDGGSIWVEGSRMIRNGGMTWYGKVPWELYTDYLNVSFASPHNHPNRPLSGNAREDPSFAGARYQVNYLYGNHKNDAGQDWCDLLWPGEDDLWARGIFSQGNGYLGVKNWWQKETAERMPSRTAFTGFDLGQIGAYPADDANGDLEDYYDSERADLIYRMVSWLGVSPNLHGKDLSPEIVRPLVDNISPGENLDIKVKLANLGTRDHATDFDVSLEIEDGDGTLVHSDSETVSSTTIPAKSRAFPTTHEMSFSWNTPSAQDEVYLINVTVEDDDDNGNNFFTREVTAREVTDIVMTDAGRDSRIGYWDLGLAGEPATIWAEFENQGSTVESFDVNIAIREPVGKEELRNWTLQVEDLGPGEKTRVSKDWTPKLAAGPMSHTQSWIRDYEEDPYLIDIGAWNVVDEETPGNNGIHSESPVDDHNGNEEQCEGIYFPVAQWAELAENELALWDLDNSDSGEDSLTRWMSSDIWANDPSRSLWVGTEKSRDSGAIHYDDEAHSRLTSPWLDFTKFQEVRYDFIYGFHTEEDNDYGAWHFRTREQADDEPTEWMPVYSTYASPNYDWNSSKWKGGNTGGQAGYLNNGQRIQNVDQDHNADEQHVQIRWIFHSDSANSENYEGVLLDGFMIMGAADNYFFNDIGVQDLSVTPRTGDADTERTIEAKVHNSGDIDAKDYKIHFTITNKENGKREREETISAEDLEYDTSWNFQIKWTPSDEGEYYINATTIYEDRWGVNLDEEPSNDFLSIVTVAAYNFASDDMESSTPRSWWDTGIADLDESGSQEAYDQWEYGSPDTDLRSGPQDVTSGSQCWGTSLDGHYFDYGDDGAYLQMDIDLSNARKPVLQFDHWARIQGQDHDRVFVRAGEVSSRGEVDEWFTIWENPVDDDDEIYETLGWEILELELFDREKDLFDFSFTNTIIQFMLRSGNDTNYAGWYIDDMIISGEQPPVKDASVDGFIDPKNHSKIAPGTEIDVKVKVSNKGREAQNIPVRLHIEDEDGFTSLDEVKETGTLEPGNSMILSWEWEVGATSGDIDHILTATAELDGEDEEYLHDNEKWISITPESVHDIGVLEIRTATIFQEYGGQRETTTVLRNFGSGAEKNIEVNLTIEDQGRNYISGETKLVSFDREEELQIPFQWTPGPERNYWLRVSASVEDDVDDTGEHRNELEVEDFFCIINPSPALTSDDISFAAAVPGDITVDRYVWRTTLDGEYYNGSEESCSSGLSPGNHIVYFSVIDTDGHWIEIGNTSLVVTERPVAIIDELDPEKVLTGEDVQFKGHGEDDGSIVRYQWRSSIDGVFGNEAEFSCSNLSTGDHTIYFRVWDDLGYQSEDVSDTLKVQARPVAYIDIIEDLGSGAEKNFRFTGHGDSERTITRYQWRSSIDGVFGNEAEFSCTNLSTGDHTIYFRVWDDLGYQSEEVNDTLKVQGRPVAYIDSIEDLGSGAEKNFRFTGHGDSEGTITRYQWQSSIDGIFGNEAEFSCTNLSTGDHTIYFHVRNDLGYWSDEVNTTLVVEKQGLYSNYNASLAVSPISLAPGSQEQPSIHGEIVAWQDNRNGKGDIFMIDLGNPEFIEQISNNSLEMSAGDTSHSQTRPQVHDGRIIWLHEWWNFNEHHYIIRLYDINDPVEGGEPLLELESLPLTLSFSGNWILWTDLADDGTIFDPFALFSYNLETGVEKKVMNFGGNYAHQEDTLFYFEEPDSQVLGKEKTILKVQDLPTGNSEEEIIFQTNPQDIDNPSVWGDYIAWEDDRLDESGWLEDGNTDIYFLDMKEKLMGPLTVNESTQEKPRVQGDYVIWTDHRNKTLSVYVYSVSRNEFALLTNDTGEDFHPVLYGDLVVWSHRKAFNDSSLLIFDLEHAPWLSSPASFGPLEEEESNRATVLIESPLEGETVQGRLKVEGEASPSPFGPEPDNYLEVYLRVDQGAWFKVGTSATALGICFWEHEINTLDLDSGVHTLYAGAKALNASTREMEFVSDIEEVEFKVESSADPIVKAPEWEPGDEWRWKYHFPESDVSFFISEKVVKKDVTRLDVQCYELELSSTSDGKTGIAWLGMDDFALIDHELPEGSVVSSFLTSGWLGALEFPFQPAPEAAPYTWSDAGNVEVPAGTFRSYLFTGDESTKVWYSPDFGNVLKLETGEYTVQAVELVGDDKDEDEDSGLFSRQLGPLPVYAYMLIALFLAVAAIGMVMQARRGMGGAGESQGGRSLEEQQGQEAMSPATTGFVPQPPGHSPGTKGNNSQQFDYSQSPQTAPPLSQPPNYPITSQPPASPDPSPGRQIPPKVRCPSCGTIIVVNSGNMNHEGRVPIQCPSCSVSGFI